MRRDNERDSSFDEFESDVTDVVVTQVKREAKQHPGEGFIFVISEDVNDYNQKKANARLKHAGLQIVNIEDALGGDTKLTIKRLP
jgi:hypothetical protein